MGNKIYKPNIEKCNFSEIREFWYKENYFDDYDASKVKK